MPEQTQTPEPETRLTIPMSNMGLLEEKIDRLNRRAAKLGQGAVVVTEVAREVRREYVGRNSLGEKVYRERTWVTLDVEGDKPVLPGWTLVGAIDHSDKADGSLNILRAARGETLPETYRKAKPVCDHCGTTRWRRDTFILRAEDGSHKQVGRNCLADFLGEGTTAASLVSWLKFVRELSTALGGLGEGVSGPSDYEWINRYLAGVAASIRVDGWVSKGRAWEEYDLTSTSSMAWSVLYPPMQKRPDHPEIMADDVEVAEKALAWIRSLPESERAEGYLANLYAACASETFRHKQDGLVASLVGAAYPRAMKDAEEAKRQAEAVEARGISTHVGEPKQRLRDLPVTIEKIRGWEGAYGYTTFVSMRDSSNNLLVWYASGDKHDSLPDEGAVCKLTGTIKKHGTDKYTGEACTHVNRCGIVALD